MEGVVAGVPVETYSPLQLPIVFTWGEKGTTSMH